MNRSILFGVLILSFFSISSWAAEFKAQARLYAAVLSGKPDDLNQEMVAQGIKEFKSIPKYGVEITYPIFSALYVGVNYSKKYLSNDEEPVNISTNYEGVLDQNTYLFVARIPIIKTEMFMIDVFGGVGGSNTKFTLKNATQDGELTKGESGDFFSSPASAYGVSASLGYKGVYFTFEGGFESNKVESLKRSGNINGNVTGLDLSGSYVAFGITFDGIKAWTK